MTSKLSFGCVAATILIASCGERDRAAAHSPRPQLRQSETVAASHPDPAITAAEVKLRLREPRQDYLFNTISMLVTRRDDIEIVTLLEDVWKGDKSGHPDLAWSTLDMPIVRVALAQTLARARPENGEYRGFLLQAINSDDRLVHTHAILALGLRGDEAALPILEKLARSDDQSRSAAAITSLAAMRRSSANAVLARLGKEYAADPSKSKAIEAALEQFRDNPQPENALKDSRPEFMQELKARLTDSNIRYREDAEGFIRFPSEHAAAVDGIKQRIEGEMSSGIAWLVDGPAERDYLSTLLTSMGRKHWVQPRAEGDWVLWHPLSETEKREVQLKLARFRHKAGNR
jgi:hypothetical protein